MKKEINPLDEKLLEACREGNFAKAEEAIKEGANVDAEDEYGKTPAIIVADYGYKDILELLIKNKTNINKQDFKGYTPLMYAIQNAFIFYAVDKKFIDIAMLLLDNGARVDIKNKNNETVFDILEKAKQRKPVEEISFIERIKYSIDKKRSIEKLKELLQQKLNETQQAKNKQENSKVFS